MGTGSLYAFDRSVKTKIADGVTVNGVDVGGLTPQAARAKLSAALLKPLDRPVSVRYQGRRFTLTEEQAQIAIDIDGSVDRALAASRAGQPAHAHLARGPRRGARRQGRGEDLVVARGGPQGRAARPRQAHDRAARRRRSTSSPAT